MNPSNAQNKFWSTFTKKHWEQKPVLVKKFKSSIVEIDQSEVFNMLVDYSNQCRKIKSADGFKLYVDGQMLYPAEILQFLPQKADKNLAGYNSRMEEYFSDYCLVCDELLQVSQESWNKLQEFTETLFTHVGFPNRFVEMGLYLGNYRQTPFGVHVDGCGVFSFPVVGKKTFRLWKPEFAEKHPALDRAQEYSRFKKNSQTMTARYGDMAYWPSSAWHIAESDGSFNATWSLGVWVDRTHQQNLESALNPLLKKKLEKSGAETLVRQTLQKNNQATLLPSNYLKSVSALKNTSENEWHDTLLKSWLMLYSKNGFKNFPKMKPQPKLSLKSRIQISSGRKILWSFLKSETKIVYAFQGTLIEVPLSDQLLKLIQNLNSEKSCLIADSLKGKDKTRDLKTLEALSRAGAFRS